MKHSKLTRALRAGTCALSVLAVASLMGAPLASADTTLKWKAPTQAKKVENTVTGAAHAMGTYTPEIVGINSVTVSAAASTLEAAETSSSLGIYGSEANVDANPYIWNQFYNLYAEANGLQKSTDVAIDPGANTKGPQAAYTIVVEEYGTCPSLYMRADVLFGTANDNGKGNVSGYNDNAGLSGASAWSYYGQEILQIRSWSDGKEGSPVVGSINADGNEVVYSDHYQKGDEDYNPIGVEYNLNNFTDWCNDIWGLANGAKTVMENKGKTVRYGDPQEIAKQFEQYTRASKWYILRQLAKEGKSKKTVAYVSGLNLETGEVTLTATPEAGKNFQGKPGRLLEATASTINDLAWTTGTSCTLEQLAKADKIILATSSASALEGAFADAKITYDSANIFDNKLPSGPQGLTMQNANSVLLTGLAQGFIYPEYISPVDMLCYYYKHILHLTDASMDDAFSMNNQGVSLPSGMEWTSKDYDDAALQKKFDQGTNWYFNNQATVAADYPEIAASTYLEDLWTEAHFLTETPAVAATCTTDGNKAYWTCEDCGKVFADADAKTETTVADCVIKATGHTNVTLPAVAATCTTDGLTAGAKCSVCGTVTTAQKSVPATGHKAVTDPAVPATYTATGLTEGSHCSVCNTVLVAQQTVPMLTPEKQVLTVTATPASVSASKVAKKAVKVAVKVKGAQGALTYTVTKKASAKISVSKAGVVTFKKGASKGTYKIKVSAAACEGFTAASKTITIKVK